MAVSFGQTAVPAPVPNFGPGSGSGSGASYFDWFQQVPTATSSTVAVTDPTPPPPPLLQISPLLVNSLSTSRLNQGPAKATSSTVPVTNPSLPPPPVNNRLPKPDVQLNTKQGENPLSTVVSSALFDQKSNTLIGTTCGLDEQGNLISYPTSDFSSSKEFLDYRLTLAESSLNPQMGMETFDSIFNDYSAVLENSGEPATPMEKFLFWD
ncbi:hypothetical protein BJ741DRAFT_634336 [Chytriomyces cf. hyalinus JEL632]|nr:hypothetical protein BJ741DRAFT_634336 [Chytriomyces cf. hyalinus JEL632]